MSDNLFIPPHFGFETKEASSVRRKYERKDGAFILCILNTALIEWHFYDSLAKLAHTHYGQLTKDRAENIISTIF